MCFNIHPRYDLSLSPLSLHFTTLICLPSSFAFEPLTSKYHLWQITMNSKGDYVVDFLILKMTLLMISNSTTLVARIYAVL
jgi:hypothetical protein